MEQVTKQEDGNVTTDITLHEADQENLFRSVKLLLAVAEGKRGQSVATVAEACAIGIQTVLADTDICLTTTEAVMRTLRELVGKLTEQDERIAKLEKGI